METKRSQSACCERLQRCQVIYFGNLTAIYNALNSKTFLSVNFFFFLMHLRGLLLGRVVDQSFWIIHQHYQGHWLTFLIILMAHRVTTGLGDGSQISTWRKWNDWALRSHDPRSRSRFWRLTKCSCSFHVWGKKTEILESFTYCSCIDHNGGYHQEVVPCIGMTHCVCTHSSWIYDINICARGWKFGSLGCLCSLSCFTPEETNWSLW